MNIISTYSVYSFSFSVAVDAAFIVKSNDYGNHDTISNDIDNNDKQQARSTDGCCKNASQAARLDDRKSSCQLTVKAAATASRFSVLSATAAMVTASAISSEFGNCIGNNALVTATAK